MVKQISDNEINLLIKYIKSILCRVAKLLSYIEDARCLKVKTTRRLCLRHGQNSVLDYTVSGFRKQAVELSGFQDKQHHISYEPYH